MKIGKEITISDNSRCFIIAEAGVNHNGNLEKAIKLIDVASEAGADAVKFQTFISSKIATTYTPKSTYHVETTGNDAKQSWLELLKSQELSAEDHRILFEYALKKKIIFLSTPYDEESVDLLSKLGVSALKVASTDLNNHRLLGVMARTNLPIILSTAMSTMNEIIKSRDVVFQNGGSSLAILQCTGSYPSKIKDLNIGAMLQIKNKTGCLTGFSDHSTEVIASSVATAAGAKIYEKHFTLDKRMPGPDHRASLEPDELKTCVELVRKTEEMIGVGEKFILDCEKENRKKLRKFTVASKNLNAGHVLRHNDFLLKRTGGEGFPADEAELILGKKLVRDIDADQPISQDIIRGD